LPVDYPLPDEIAHLARATASRWMPTRDAGSAWIDEGSIVALAMAGSARARQFLDGSRRVRFRDDSRYFNTTSPVSSNDLRLERIFGHPPDTASITFESARSIEWWIVSFTADSCGSSSIAHCA